MPPSRNEMAATMTRGQAAAAGVLDADSAVERITTNSRRMYGFTRKTLPQGLPQEPKLYIYSVSEYGAEGPNSIDLGPGFRRYVIESCPEKAQHGPACVIDPVNFFEEAKVDVTEHTFVSGQEIVDAILKIGPGMNASWDRRRIGWFVSKFNPPHVNEVAAAVSVYTVECQRLLQEGNRFASANKLNEINETHRRAAKYLRQKVDWDKPMQKMMDCPTCGEPVREGIVMHATPYCGHVFNWVQAIENGLKKLEDVPPNIKKAISAQIEAQE